MGKIPRRRCCCQVEGYVCLSVAMHSSELMYLPAKRLRLREKSLVTKFKQGGGAGYIDEAINLDREALKRCPPGHHKRSVSLTLLAIHLSDRYGQLGATGDLEEAIVLDREALNLRPQGRPDRSMSLNNLATHLSTRYNQLGAMQDLDEAIVLDQEALDLRPQGHPDRSMSLNNLEVVFPLGTTSSGKWRTTIGPSSSTEKHSTFAQKGTLIGQNHCATLQMISSRGTTNTGKCRT
jgi:tetratricopeptide (TPR) repeat protein